jgi:hypothetical protein
VLQLLSARCNNLADIGRFEMRLQFHQCQQIL